MRQSYRGGGVLLLIPAVDLKGGKCVRLIQGQKGREIVYGDDPVAWALRWVEQGAQRLHLIDLDGAFDGAPAHIDVLAQVAGGCGRTRGVRRRREVRSIAHCSPGGGGELRHPGHERAPEPGIPRIRRPEKSRKNPVGHRRQGRGSQNLGLGGGRLGIARVAGEPLRRTPSRGNHIHRHPPRRHACGLRPRPHRRAWRRPAVCPSSPQAG